MFVCILFEDDNKCSSIYNFINQNSVFQFTFCFASTFLWCCRPMVPILQVTVQFQARTFGSNHLAATKQHIILIDFPKFNTALDQIFGHLQSSCRRQLFYTKGTKIILNWFLSRQPILTIFTRKISNKSDSGWIRIVVDGVRSFYMPSSALIHLAIAN